MADSIGQGRNGTETVTISTVDSRWTAAGTDSIRPGFALTVIAISTLLSMSVWFSASFVVPQLRVEWGLSSGQSSLLTIAVQLGFVVGALASAATGLADRFSGRFLICVGALGAGAANLALLFASGLAAALPLRMMTGFFLAAVYPPALKEVSTWFQAGRGKALGVMIGALTVGSALPHMVNVFGDLDWHVVIATTSLLTAAGGGLILLLRHPGPYPFPQRPFSFASAFGSLRNRDVVLANLGYMGHMWELYAMWAWVGAFILSLPGIAASSRPEAVASILAFCCIGVGAFGCLVGGYLSDRLGRAKAAFVCLVASGGAALVLGVSYSILPTYAVLVICLFWGFWVIADSAQFSALVTERADPSYIGGALSMQLAFGYLTTTITLWLVPTLVARGGWHQALIVLALGPVVGAISMRMAIARDNGRAAA